MLYPLCLHYLSFPSFFPIPLFHLLLSLFSLSLGDDTKWPTRVDMSLNLTGSINQKPLRGKSLPGSRGVGWRLGGGGVRVSRLTGLTCLNSVARSVKLKLIFLTILILMFEEVQFTTLLMCQTTSTQCRPWWDAAFCTISSDLGLRF